MSLYPRRICENCMINVVVGAARIGNNSLMGCTMTHACSQDILQLSASFYKTVPSIGHLLSQLLIKQAHPPRKRRNMDYREGEKVLIGSIPILCFIPLFYSTQALSCIYNSKCPNHHPGLRRQNHHRHQADNKCVLH